VVVSRDFDEEQRKKDFHAALARMDKAAKLLMTKPIIDMVSTPGFGENLHPLLDAGLFRLPFDPVVVEFEPPTLGGRWFICLRHLRTHPHILGIDVFYMYQEDQKTGYFSDHRSIMAVDKEAMEIINVDDKSCGTAVGGALLMAVLCHVTKGVQRTKTPAPERLNKARARKGKSIIPEYTVMSVGHVYDKHGNPQAWGEAGGPRTLHWRRAHKRRQRYGVGLTQTREIMIDAMLVNYNPGDEMPEMPKRKVKI
jgi:hypothetical protein